MEGDHVNHKIKKVFNECESKINQKKTLFSMLLFFFSKFLNIKLDNKQLPVLLIIMMKP